MSTAQERAIEALRVATGKLDAALDRVVADDPATVTAAREAAEEVVVTAWTLVLRLDGLDDDEVRAFALGFMEGLRSRAPVRRWIPGDSGPGWTPDGDQGGEQ